MTAPLVLPAGASWPELTTEQQVAVLDYVVSTCLLHGALPSTAYLVAAELAHGLDTEPRRRSRMPR